MNCCLDQTACRPGFFSARGRAGGPPVTGQGRHSGSPVLNVALVTRRRITSHPRSLVLKNGARVAGDVRPGGVWWRLVDAISIPSGVSWVGDRLASVEGPLVGLLPERGDADGCGLGGWHSMSLRLFSLPPCPSSEERPSRQAGDPTRAERGWGTSPGHVASYDPSLDVTQCPSRGILIDQYSCKDPLGFKDSPWKVSLSWCKTSLGDGVCGGLSLENTNRHRGCG